MTSYHLRRDFGSLTGECHVTDAEGQERFRIEGRWLKGGVTFTDLVSGDVLVLAPILRSMNATWEVRRNDTVIAMFEGSGWFLPSFTLDVPGPNDYTIEQKKVFGLDAVVTRPVEGRVARIHQPSGRSGDLQIDVEPGQDEVFIAACAAILMRIRSQ